VGNDQPDRLKAELQTKNDIVLTVAVPGCSRYVGISSNSRCINSVSGLN
jgi:hypothetical protein